MSAECTCEVSPLEFGGPIPDRGCPIHGATAEADRASDERELHDLIAREMGLALFNDTPYRVPLKIARQLLAAGWSRSSAADRARAEVQAAVLALAELWSNAADAMGHELPIITDAEVELMRAVVRDLRAALSDTAALDRMLDKARAEVQAAVLAVIDEYFDLSVDSWDDGACPEPEDVWRFHRDIKAALTDTAALDRMLAEARAEALRDAADAIPNYGRTEVRQWLRDRAEGEGANG